MTAAPLTRILYVEDDPSIQAVAKLSLERVGKFQTRICSSGQEALAALKEFLPDMILLDVMMPDMDGPDTLRAIRALPEAAAIPIVFLTAKIQPAEKERLAALGAVGVLSKPFNPMSLPAEIREIWERVHG